MAYPSRTRHRLKTRDRVFAAALAEFRRVGVASAQIEDIVKTAGVARGTFYLHFPTKDHVLMELLRRKQNGIVDSKFPERLLDPRPVEASKSLPDGRIVARCFCGHTTHLESTIS